MKKSSLFLIWLLSLSASAASPRVFPRWCELSAKKDVGPYINAAAGFVDIDPILLATGMSSEGFAIKSDCSTKKADLLKKPTDEIAIAEEKRLCEPDRLKAFNISGLAAAQAKAKPEEWKLAQDYAPINGTFASVDPTNGFTEIITTRKAIETSYYGTSWIDDGSDTFGLEYSKMREKNYIPKKFSSSDYKQVNGSSFNSMPDFVFMTDESDRNEPASNRFKSNEGPYVNRYARQTVTQGDKGRTHYKTAEAQTFANAALWKHSQDKFNSARKELGIVRDFSPVEMAFWSKVFYNGGQGTQAAAWDVLKQFAVSGWLANDKYLTVDPGVSLKEIYNNARDVSDSYAVIVKDHACSDLLASRAGTIKAEDYRELGSSGPTKNADPSKSTEQ